MAAKLPQNELMKTLLWKLEDIPNVGPRIANDFRKLGILYPKDLKGKDPLKLYKALIKKTGTHQDPCVLDTFMAAVDFVKTGKPKKWWEFTARRKKLLNAAK